MTNDQMFLMLKATRANLNAKIEVKRIDLADLEEQLIGIDKGIAEVEAIYNQIEDLKSMEL